ncbi:MAG: hypothetical protein KC547_09780 [Anaerolineae bacterium]|nr:hypothetical protein [Anaerolineae bacterium]
MARIASVLFLFTLFLSQPVHAQRNTLDHTLHPNFDTIGRMSEESWSRRSPSEDYVTTVISGQSGRVTVSSATQYSAGCVGYATAAPTTEVYWVRDNMRESERLRLFYISRDNSSLIVRKPDGTWLCNDDSFGTNNPTIDIERPRSGNYFIWIASETESQTLSGTLYATLEDYSPQRYPIALSDPWVSIFTGSGHTGGLLYVNAFTYSDRLVLSIDVYFRNMNGAQRARVAAWPLDSNGSYFAGSRNNSDENGNLYVVDEFSPPFGSSNFDYSDGGFGPIELTLPDNAFAGSRITYSVDIRVQVFDDSSSQWIDLDTYGAYHLPKISHTT